MEVWRRQDQNECGLRSSLCHTKVSGRLCDFQGLRHAALDALLLQLLTCECVLIGSLAHSPHEPVFRLRLQHDLPEICPPAAQVVWIHEDVLTRACICLVEDVLFNVCHVLQHSAPLEICKHGDSQCHAERQPKPKEHKEDWHN